MRDDTLSWDAEEFSFTPKRADWYWSVALIAILVALFSLYLGNFLFAALAIFAGLAFMLEGGRRPQTKRYAITPHGVRAGEKFYPFNTIAHFSISDDPSPELIISVRAPLSPRIEIPLAGIDADRIREALAGKIGETEHARRFADVLARRMGL